jgi:hypothetical protein
MRTCDCLLRELAHRFSMTTSKSYNEPKRSRRRNTIISRAPTGLNAEQICANSKRGVRLRDQRLFRNPLRDQRLFRNPLRDQKNCSAIPCGTRELSSASEDAADERRTVSIVLALHGIGCLRYARGVLSGGVERL